MPTVLLMLLLKLLRRQRKLLLLLACLREVERNTCRGLGLCGCCARPSWHRRAGGFRDSRRAEDHCQAVCQDRQGRGGQARQGCKS